VVFGRRPLRLLVYVPRPVPSIVLKSEIVGLPAVFQHIPLAATEKPLSAITFPEQLAVVVVIFVISPVETSAINNVSCGVQAYKVTITNKNK